MIKVLIVDDNLNYAKRILNEVLKFNITSDTQVIGNIAKGKEIKIQYKDSSVSEDKLELKSIEVIER